jgi:hypothetical protein
MHIPHRSRFVVFVPALLALCFANPAAAFNSAGHMIISIVAFDHMDAATQTKVLELLHLHPRFNEQILGVIPYELRDAPESERALWVFAYCSTWPDVVRSASERVSRDDVNRYNRPYWHYVNEPVFLSEADERALRPTLKFNRDRVPPADLDFRQMNIIQAIKNSSRIVADKSAAADLRAVHLCWLLHLGGDSHQPMHSCALVTSRRYPEGDHGGNYLHYQHDYPLHAFWDNVLSTEESYGVIRRSAADLQLNAELGAAAEKAARTLDPGDWIDEGCILAKKYAYSPEVVAKIAAREGHPHLGDLNPSPQYEIDAENVTEQQAVTAGHRLAKLLEQLLK